MMKRNIREFFRRGIVSFGFGPIILAVLYRILQQQGAVQMLTVDQVCRGVFSLSALAFIAGGMNFVYQIERLPLMVAILIHGSVLYFSYLATYLVNDWLEQGIRPILVFSTVFLLGYLLIWAVIYYITKRNTERINVVLMKKRQSREENQKR